MHEKLSVVRIKRVNFREKCTGFSAGTKKTVGTNEVSVKRGSTVLILIGYTNSYSTSTVRPLLYCINSERSSTEYFFAIRAAHKQLMTKMMVTE